VNPPQARKPIWTHPRQRRMRMASPRPRLHRQSRIRKLLATQPASKEKYKANYFPLSHPMFGHHMTLNVTLETQQIRERFYVLTRTQMLHNRVQGDGLLKMVMGRLVISGQYSSQASVDFQTNENLKGSLYAFLDVEKLEKAAQRAGESENPNEILYGNKGEVICFYVKGFVLKYLHCGAPEQSTYV